MTFSSLSSLVKQKELKPNTNAWTVLVAATQSARKAGSTVTCMHVLAALFEERSFLFPALKRAYPSLLHLAPALHQAIAPLPGHQPNRSETTPFDEEVARAAENAKKHQEAFSEITLGTVHLFLGCLAQERTSLAGKLFRQKQVCLDAARDALLLEHHGQYVEIPRDSGRYLPTMPLHDMEPGRRKNIEKILLFIDRTALSDWL